MSLSYADILMSPASATLCLVLHLCVAALLLEAMVARVQHAPARHVVVSVIAAAWAFFLLTVIVCGMRSVEMGKDIPSAATRMLAWPCGIYVWGTILCGACAAAESVALVRWKRGHVTPSSIKAALDDLPKGLCFSDKRGTCILCNARMHGLSRALCGHEVRSAEELWHQARRASNECVGENEFVLRLANKSVWLLCREHVEVAGHQYVQISDTDVTEVHRLTNELREHNARLRKHRERMRSYGMHVREVERAREVLEAKASVHDKMGYVLLSTKYCLAHEDSYNRQDLVLLWKETLNDLVLTTRDDALGQEAYDELMDVARSLGVDVRLEGDLPSGGPAMALMARALRECITNVAKHAPGGELVVCVLDDGRAFTLTSRGASSTGEVPEEREVREGGGLGTLRRMAEDAGWAMRVTDGPEFQVELRS